jgi:hypothetical protein
MPIPNDYREVIAILFEKTEQGALNWVDDGSNISVKVDQSKFSLWSGVDEKSDESFVAFGLVNSANKIIDSWYLDEPEFEYQEVLRLFRSAKRHANGVPSLLKSLTQQISTMKKGTS